MAQNLLSYTLEEGHKATANISNIHSGFIADSVTLSLSVDGELSTSISGMGKNEDASGTSIQSYAAQAETPQKGFNGSVTMGGVQTEVQNWSLNFGNATKTLHGQGARQAVAGGSHTLNVSFNARLAYNANTWDTAIKGAAATTTATAPAGTTIVFGADNGVTLGSGKRAISMALANCQYTSMRRNVPLSDYIMTDLSGNGVISTTTFVDGVVSASW
jgi:hypothetical protein